MIAANIEEYLSISRGTISDCDIGGKKRESFINFDEHFFSMFYLTSKTTENSIDVLIVVVRLLEVFI